MMKIKYLRLSKKEQADVKDSFYKTQKGIVVQKNLKVAKICAILCIIYSIYLVFDYLLNKGSITDLLFAIAIFIFGLAGILYAHRIFLKAVNEYVIKSKK